MIISIIIAYADHRFPETLERSYGSSDPNRDITALIGSFPNSAITSGKQGKPLVFGAVDSFEDASAND